MVLTIGILRECFRNLQAFRAVFETTQVDVISGPGGEELCLWDLEYLYSQIDQLPERQHQAIELFLVCNLKEEEVAQLMGIAPSNPVGMYATAGLRNILRMVREGAFDRFHSITTAA